MDNQQKLVLYSKINQERGTKLVRLKFSITYELKQS